MARGFTLVELVIALALAGLLAGLAVPSYARYLAEQRLRDDAHRLANAIELARSESIKRNAHVVICATTPTQACGDAHHWHEGWVLFEDRDGNAEFDPPDALVQRDGIAAPGVTMAGNRPVEQYLRFDFLGRARLVSGALQMGTIEVCKSGLRGFRVVLANSGRTRVEPRSGPCP